MDPLILSRLKRRVELALAVLLLLPALGATSTTRARADTFDDREPAPVPQVELPAHSDYTDARALLRQRKWEEAAIVLRSVLRKTPDFFPGAIELARALVYVGRREEALTLLTQTAARQRGERRAAVVERQRVLSRIFLQQKTFQIYQDGLNLLTQGKHHAARERLERALEAEPDNIEILTRIGQCLVLEGDYDSAAERLRVAKRLNPYELEVNLWLGRALQQRGELNLALAELKAAREGLDSSERAPLWYAAALVAAGNRKSAVQVLESDTEDRPFHLIAVVALARLRIETYRDGSDSLWTARKELQVALSRLPQYASTESATRSEGELGVELKESGEELKSQITALLAQLDGRLRDSQRSSNSRTSAKSP